MKTYWSCLSLIVAINLFSMAPLHQSSNPPLRSSQLPFPELLNSMKKIYEWRAAQPPKQPLMKPLSQSTTQIAIATSEEMDLYPLTCGVPICTLLRTKKYNN